MEVSGRKADKGEAFSKKLFCDPCNVDSVHEDAIYYCTDCNEFLCGNCSNNHKKSKAFRNHTLLDKDAMPAERLETVRGKFCPTHKREMINYLCNQHYLYCCSVCVTQNHKHCDVQYMLDIADNEEYKGLLQTLSDLESQVTDRMSIANTTKVKVGELFERLKTRLNLFRSDLNTKLDIMERLTISEAQQIKTDDINSLESTLTSLDTIKKGLRYVSSNLVNLEKYQQNRQLFISAEKAQTKVNEYAREFDKLSCQNSVIREYTLKPREEVLHLLNSSNLWTLEIAKMEVETPEREKQMKQEKKSDDPGITQAEEHVNIHTLSEPATLYTGGMFADREAHGKKAMNKMVAIAGIRLGQINTKHGSDVAIYQLKNESWITGIELLDINTLALADHDNNSIKIVGLKSDKIMSCCNLDERPHDLTSIYQTRIVATCDSELVFLLLNTWILSIEKRLPVEPGCRGIAYHKNKLFLTFVGERPCVEILDMEGNVLRVFANENTKPKAFIDPQYIAVSTDGRSLFISDHGKHSVAILDMKGNVTNICEHENLKYPTGLVQDDNGAIIVAGKASNNIHRISQQGSPIQIVLDTLEWPQALAYSGINNRLYVTQCASSFISVFQLK